MLDASAIPADARLYLLPTQFAATPVGRDGEVVRVAGGLTWCAAFDLIAVSGGRRVVRATVPVGALEGVIGQLPPAQAERLRAQAARIAAPRAPLQLGQRVLRLDQPQVMAILNVTPDSFSDGGKHGGDPAASARAGFDMTVAGAGVIDVGGESTRPGAATLWEGDEIARVVPVIEALAATGAAISADTRKAAVMEAALTAGAHMINDVAALEWDDRAAGIVAAAGCPIALMHSPDPKTGGHGQSGYGDVLIEVFDWLEAAIARAEAAGIDRAKILVDPGIGFGKSLAANLALLNGLALFHGLGCAILLGVSRKRMIGALDNEVGADARLGGSLALATLAAERGVQLIRVHDVAETVQALRVWRGLRDAALTERRG